MRFIITAHNLLNPDEQREFGPDAPLVDESDYASFILTFGRVFNIKFNKEDPDGMAKYMEAIATELKKRMAAYQQKLKDDPAID